MIYGNLIKHLLGIINLLSLKVENDSFLVERKGEIWLKNRMTKSMERNLQHLLGRVYPFDRKLDVGYFPYNPNFPTFCSIDFGYRMPAVGWFQTQMINGEWHINIIDEIIHETNIKTDELIRLIKSKPYYVRAYYGDPAGKQAQGQSGMGDIEIFRQNGISYSDY